MIDVDPGIDNEVAIISGQSSFATLTVPSISVNSLNTIMDDTKF